MENNTELKKFLLPVGETSTQFLKGFYNSSKSKLEENIGKVLNKKVDLGDYSGIRFLGISLANPKIMKRFFDMKKSILIDQI